MVSMGPPDLINSPGIVSIPGIFQSLGFSLLIQPPSLESLVLHRY